MSEIVSYSISDVENWVGKRELSKGRPYLNEVSHVEINGPSIQALVQGTRSKPYQVNIVFHASGNSPKTLRCSCPVGSSCKHTAATLLKVMMEPRIDSGFNPAVIKWLDQFVSQTRDSAQTFPKKTATKIRLFYVLNRSDNNTRTTAITFFKAKVNKEGVIVADLESWGQVERAIMTPPQFLEETDISILRALYVSRQRDSYQDPQYHLQGQQGDKILRQILGTGRFYLENEKKGDYSLLKSGTTRSGTLQWRSVSNNRVKSELVTIPASQLIIPCEPLWYVDDTTCEIGQIEIGQFENERSFKAIRALLDAPILTEQESVIVTSVINEAIPMLPLPKQPTNKKMVVIDENPRPILTLDTIFPKKGVYSYGYSALDYATLQFQYGDTIIPCDHKGEFSVGKNNEIIQLKRKIEQEKKILKTIKKHGFDLIATYLQGTFFKHDKKIIYELIDNDEWASFVKKTIPILEKEGWNIQIAPDFRHYVLEVEDWQVNIHESETGWFDLTMGIIVDGQALSLPPLLAHLFKSDSRWISLNTIKKIKDDEAFFLHTPEGKRFTVSALRLKPLAQTLIDLFDGDPNAVLKISKFDAPRIVQLFSDSQRWQFKNADAIIDLAERLSASAKIKKVKQPKKFGITLRPYQCDGLSWLQYLREHQLSGILADDMGLGKTAQTLAHLQLEKEQGRLKGPSLIVLPTSLIFNWRNEAARFAPDLSVLVLHGADRKEKFPLIPQNDLILTTYPLLWRDHEIFYKYHYYYLILDEAQMVKNVKSNAASVIRNIISLHRLAITGTPLENHLGELWSQFDFLLPGFLGDQKSFGRVWRTPIEKNGDTLRKNILAQRIRPFILRRRKEDVAKELPPKTTIIRSVKLEKGQRDLYETVRSSMDKKVRDAIAANGFQRSQIILLDALLKLRQVCCDPRLLPSENAKKVAENAKLSLLMEILDELLSENRRILLFSQFTSMLSLIQEELDAKQIAYMKLTGQTKDRETPIQHFQKGKIPLFLISLKSGGVGLNLTAADTVIHYDPWWNPAVENQATDRAHRLGQTKPIFVYKLIIEGSIEERILALQEKKAALASSILSEDKHIDVKFGENDLRALFAPLPE